MSLESCLPTTNIHPEENCQTVQFINDSLPPELWSEVFFYCGFRDVHVISLVCRSFNFLVGKQQEEKSNHHDGGSGLSLGKKGTVDFAHRYYMETRRVMERLMVPELVYHDDDEQLIHCKTRSLLFDWLDLDERSVENCSSLKGFVQLREDIEFIRQDEIDWNQFEELTEKFNSLSYSGPKKWFGVTLLDKRGERIPIFCRLSQMYESAEREMVFIILACFDSNDHITGNLSTVTKIREASFYYEYLGFDSMSSFSGFEWILDHLSRYIFNDKTELALFGSALEFYVKTVKSRKFTRNGTFPRIRENRMEYYFNQEFGQLLCFNSLHRGVNQVYEYSNLDSELMYLPFDVQQFYSKHKKQLSLDE